MTSVRRPRVDVALNYASHGHSPKNLIVLHETISPDYPGLKDLIGVGGYATVLALGAAMVFPVTVDASVAATAWAGMLRLLVTSIAFGPVVWYFDARTGLIRALALHSVRDLLTKRGD